MPTMPYECAHKLMDCISGRYRPPEVSFPDQYVEDFGYDQKRILTMVWLCGIKSKEQSRRLHIRYYPKMSESRKFIQEKGLGGTYLAAGAMYQFLTVAYRLDLDEDEDDLLYVRSLCHLLFHARKSYRLDFVERSLISFIRAPFAWETPENMLESFLELVQQFAYRSWYSWKQDMLSDAYVNAVMRRIYDYCENAAKSCQ